MLIDPNGMWVERGGGLFTDNPAEIAAFMDGRRGKEDGDDDGKKKKQGERFSLSGLTSNYTGPLEATMTPEQRAEYFKESAEGVAWIMGGELLFIAKVLGGIGSFLNVEIFF